MSTLSDGEERLLFTEVVDQEFAAPKLKLAQNVDQTPGFPGYYPTNYVRRKVYNRCPAQEYIALLADQPWVNMFQHRVRTLFLVPAGNRVIFDIASQVWNFMFEMQRAYWESFHWLPIKQEPTSMSIYNLRGLRRSSLLTRFNSMVNKFRRRYKEEYNAIHGQFWLEPGFWHPCAHPCFWIPPSQEHLSEDDRLPLRHLVRDIDRLEPVRVGFATDTAGMPSWYQHLDKGTKTAVELTLRRHSTGDYRCPVTIDDG